MVLTIPQKILSAFLVVLIIYWILLNSSGAQTGFWNYFYSFSFSLIPLIGGVVGMFQSRTWGFLSSAVGKAIFYTSAGLSSWGLGSMVWAYYNFFEQIEVPYPSIADFWYILALPLWVYGAINLSKATGAKFALENIKGRSLLIIVPVIVTLFSYYLLVTVARGGVISDGFDGGSKIFFDFAYPIGDVFILTIATLIFGLSFKFFGGLFKIPIFSLLLGFAVMYVADFIFSFTTTIETFYVGHFGDLIFTIALFLMTFGIFGFNDKTKMNQ